MSDLKTPEKALAPKAPVRRDWRIPDELWLRLEPLIPVPPQKPHPLGCHRQRIPNRKAMDGIFFVLRTGCQWNALGQTGICSSSVAHSRFQEWSAAGVFETLWKQALAEYDDLVGIDWNWLSMDGAMTKAPGAPKRGRRRKASAPTPPTGAKLEPSAAC